MGYLVAFVMSGISSFAVYETFGAGWQLILLPATILLGGLAGIAINRMLERL